MLESILDGRRLNMEIDDSRLTVRRCTALAVLMNELVSNATKHGRGDISVTFAMSDGAATLAVEDRGPGFPSGFDASASATTGLELVQTLARCDLQGTAAFENLPQGGARAEIQFRV